MPVSIALSTESQTAYLKAGKRHQLSCFLPCWKLKLFFKKPTALLKKRYGHWVVASSLLCLLLPEFDLLIFGLP